MTVEVATYIDTLDATYPTSNDPKSEGDNHLRLIKNAIKATFPNITGPVTKTQAQLNATAGDVTGPASSVDNTLPRFDSTTGKLLQSSGVTVDDSNNITGIASINGGQLAGMRNKIINGKMEIAQRGTSFPAAAATAFTLDRWANSNISAAVLTISQQADVPSGNEFRSSLRFAVTTADTSIAASDRAEVRYVAEGYDARDLIGRTFTFSFWVRSSKTGIHCAAFRNTGGDRSYVTEYTVNAANTWEQKSVTVSGGLITAGTWDWTTGQGLMIAFALATGTTFHAAKDAWQTGNFLGTANQVNVLDTIGNIFAITGVQLEVGSVATPFEHRPFGAELQLCQRYFEKSYNQANAPGAISASDSTYFLSPATKVAQPVQFKVAKRAIPTITFYSTSTGATGVAYDGISNIAVGTGSVVGESSMLIYASVGFTVNSEVRSHWTASAEL